MTTAQWAALALGGGLIGTPLGRILVYKRNERRDRRERLATHREALKSSARARVDDLTIGGK